MVTSCLHSKMTSQRYLGSIQNGGFQEIGLQHTLFIFITIRINIIIVIIIQGRSFEDS